MKLLERKIDDIAKLCRLNKVSKLFVFGSVLRETFNHESDIDLIVNFEQVPQV
jgi:predicted nucleotidyltransferase